MGATVLFDGVCNFCNGSVNFIIERDSAGYFKFAPLQSEIADELSTKHDIDRSETDSIILVEDGKAYTHSTAALRIARKLDGIWKLGYAFVIVPRPIRDAAYKLFAKYRYRLFGRQDACMVPTPGVRARFLV
jgi:predicted DCC family thiol-disulfide oxidoreductase YuxK